MKYKHIMLAVDINADATPLIQKAVALARNCVDDALLSIIHVDMNIAHTYEGMLGVDLETREKEHHDKSMEAMKTMLDTFEYPIHKHILYTGDIDYQISKAITEFDVDLLVMGHHPSNVIKQIFYSPSEPLVRDMPCDLLLVKLEN